MEKLSDTDLFLIILINFNSSTDFVKRNWLGCRYRYFMQSFITVDMRL